MESVMQCPYCGRTMARGALLAPRGQGVFWLPDGAVIKGAVLREKDIRAAGGVVLDKLLPAGFLAKERPDSFYCESCRVVVTRCSP